MCIPAETCHLSGTNKSLMGWQVSSEYGIHTIWLNRSVKTVIAGCTKIMSILLKF